MNTTYLNQNQYTLFIPHKHIKIAHNIKKQKNETTLNKENYNNLQTLRACI